MTQTSDSVAGRGQVFPWLVVALVLVLAAGGFFWMDRKIEALQTTNDQANGQTNDQQKVAALQQTVQDIQSAQQDIQQKLASEGSERKALADQLGALSSRVDALASANAESRTPAAPEAQKNKRGKR